MCSVVADIAKAMLRDAAMERCLMLTSVTSLMLMFSRSVELGVLEALSLVERFLRVRVETVCVGDSCFSVPSTREFVYGAVSSVLGVASFMVHLSAAVLCLGVLVAAVIFCKRFKGYMAYVSTFVVGWRRLAVFSTVVYAASSLLASLCGSLSGYAIALLVCRLLSLVSGITLPVYATYADVAYVTAEAVVASTCAYVIAYVVVRG